MFKYLHKCKQLFTICSRVSVITGSVVLRDGSPALGTRVEIAEQRQAGFSLTRENGT